MNRGENAGATSRVIAGTLGLLLVVGFYGLALTRPGLSIQFLPPWDHVATGELLGWLGHIILVVPGGLLLGWAFAPIVTPWLEVIVERLEEASVESLRNAVVGVAALAFGVAIVGRMGFLDGWPITDDENATRFGGRILARGGVTVPAAPVMAYFPRLFLFAREGSITSFDWLGGQLAWALGEATRTDGVVFTLAAAFAPALVAVAAARRFGVVGGAAAAFVFFTSPMAQCLSWTTHPHLLSRAAIAGAVAVAASPRTSAARVRSGAFGLLFGVGLLCRPFETMTLLAPLAAGELWDARREGRFVQRTAAMFLGALPMLALFAWHNHAVTGFVHLPARFAENAIPTPEWRRPWESLSDGQLLWRRFSVNVVFNVLRVGVWFWGPVGMMLIVLGANHDAFTRRLTAGLAVLFALGLAHDDAGIHAVGPMHQSESVVFLSVLAVAGARRIATVAARASIAPSALAAVMVVMGSVAGGVFMLRQAQALHAMVTLQDDVYGWMERDTSGPAFVLVPKIWEIWSQEPYLAAGTWVLAWRPPDPFFEERVLVAVERDGTYRALRDAFPDRRAYLLGRDASGAWRVVPVDGSGGE
ncbi:MAG: hypothetical protein AAGN82_19575 [Myxococcota bacterium]